MSALERVQAAFTGLKAEIVLARDATPCFEIASADVHEACRRLRDGAGFETNTFVTAIDRFPAEPRFEVSWQFLSIAHNDRVRLRARLASEAARVATITDLFPGAAYSERECYDMFGIRFEGHANLRRLLMPEDYGHFPLRKDFPHQGIEPDRLYREWDARRHERAAVRAQTAADAGRGAAAEGRPIAAAEVRSRAEPNARLQEAPNEHSEDNRGARSGDAHSARASSGSASSAGRSSGATHGLAGGPSEARSGGAARGRDVSGGEVR